MTDAGRRIIEGLEAAIAGDLSAVTINGQRWIRATPGEDNARAAGYLAGLEEAARIAEGARLSVFADDDYSGGRESGAQDQLEWILYAIRARIAELRKEPAK